MYTPTDLAKVIARRKEEQKYAIEVELSMNAHFVFDETCDHHCSDCCFGLYLQNEPREKNTA